MTAAAAIVRGGPAQLDLPEVVVRARGLGVRLGDRRVLCGVDLSVPAGGITALLGANGAGKTTLLRALAMLVRPSEGALELFGAPARPEPDIRGRIGFIGHQVMLYRDLTVMENLELFARLHGTARGRAAALVEEMGLAGVAREQVGVLSRGMAQRAAIARAMLHSPALLLADEPFTGLDVASAEWLGARLLRVASEGAAVVFSGHDLGRARGLAERAVVLREGRVAMEGEAGVVTDWMAGGTGWRDGRAEDGTPVAPGQAARGAEEAA
ncbi:MAG: ABC transporter ATP-binding protein [Phycisphaerales bacterium]